MSAKSHRIIFISALLSILLLGGCTTIYNPATGRNEMLLIDTEQEVSLGLNMDRQIKSDLDVLDDHYMQGRLQRIGGRVASVSDRQDLKYTFQIIDDEELNAFAAPGGYIYVNKGLIESTTDDELACVLAHETGHIAARHSAKKLQAVMGYQLLFAVAAGAGAGSDILQATDIVFNVVALGYSRQDENLADKLSVRYAKRSGFDPQGSISFFKKLQAEADQKGTGYTIVFLSSHPPIKDRIENIEREIQQTP